MVFRRGLCCLERLTAAETKALRSSMLSALSKNAPRECAIIVMLSMPAQGGGLICDHKSTLQLQELLNVHIVLKPNRGSNSSSDLNSQHSRKGNPSHNRTFQFWWVDNRIGHNSDGALCIALPLYLKEMDAGSYFRLCAIMKSLFRSAIHVP